MRRFVLASALALWVVIGLCYSQVTDANLVGSVVDASGAAVPNASVEITNVATGVKTKANTNVSGQYRFNNIPIGTYDLAVNASGFAPATLKSIVIELSKTSTQNVALQVGTVSTSVEVSAAAATIDTTTAQVQSNFEAKTIVNLPIIENGNSFFGALNVSLLGSGVASNGGVGQGTGPSVGGQRPMNNNFMIEGVDNNNKTVTGPLVYVPTEATAEFTLLQNQYGAEFGHSSGGQFNTIVKSGTNEFHGDLYEYFQNKNLNAVDEIYADQGIRTNPRYDQNKFGGTIGGPIRKDKLFFFGSLEYAPWGYASTVGTPVEAPTAQGFALLDQMSNISKTNYNIFKQYVPAAPAATDSTTVNGVKIPTGILPIAGANYVNFLTYLGSVDYNISNSDQLRGRFIANKYDSLDNTANLPTFWTTLPQRFYTATASEFHTFTPNVTNEFRLGYNRFSQFYTTGSNLKFPGLDMFPNIQLDTDLGLQIGPNPNAPQFAVQNTYQLVDNLNWTHGRHTFKFGFDGRNSISPQQFIQRMRGDYDYADLQEYLTDQIPSDLAERNLGGTSYYGNQWATYLYGTDTWRIRNNISLYLGVRWERTTVPLGMGLQSLNSVASVPGFIEFSSPKTANGNFAPRIGIAYSPGSSGHTSIRAGFGMAYDVIYDNIGTLSYPPQLSATYDAGNFPAIFKTPFLANGGIFPGSLPGGTSLTAVEARQSTSSYIPDQKLPYSVQWNIGVQHVFHNDWTFESRYLGTRGVHLLVQNRLNIQDRVSSSAYLPTYLTAPSQATLDGLTWSYGSAKSPTVKNLSTLPLFVPSWANAGFNGSNVVGFMPWGNSLYNGWANQLTKRFSRSFSLIAAYTWSHNLDDSTASAFSTLLTPRRPQDFRNLRAEWSNSALDRNQRFTFNWVYELPYFSKSDNWAEKNLLGNWRLVGTYTAETGEWVTAQSGVDSNLNGDSAGDRNIINPAGQANLGSGVKALKNSAGDTVAYLATNPNARYIQAGSGALANGGKNTVQMPGINNFDVSLGKQIKFGEKRSFEFRGDFTNLMNHPQYTAGFISSVKLTSQITNRNFLLPANASFQQWSQNFSSNPRQLQLAAKIVF